MKRFKKILNRMLPALIAVLATSSLYAGDGDKVRNVILMIGDGMGLTHVYAAMAYKAPEPLNLERAEYTGIVKTHSANSRVTDSAAAGTALSTGHKTLNDRAGLSVDGEHLENLIEKASRHGFATGVVVTSSLTNATPAAFLAHQPDRHMEEEIALDIAYSPADVLFGGGTAKFEKRKDGRNLSEEMCGRGYRVVKEFGELDDITNGRIVGLFAENNLPGMRSGRGDYLPRATAKALDVLSNNSEQGFFLMIEGSLIDGASHNNNIEAVIRETVDFDEAVGVAFDYADRHKGTLVIVVADHETGGLTIASYGKDYSMTDGVKFTEGGHSSTLVPVYAYGPGAENFTGIIDNTQIAYKIARLLAVN